MAVQSAIFEGKVSNLKDAWTNLSATLGDAFLPAAKESVSAMTEILNELNKNTKSVMDWRQSTNSNVLLVATAFDLLKTRSNGLHTVGNNFTTNMKKMADAASIAASPINTMIFLTEKLLRL